MDRDIFDEMRRMAEEMDQMFGSSSCPSCQRTDRSQNPQNPPKREPIVEVQQTDTDIIVTAELPGMEKEDIDLNVTSERIKITAEKNSPEAGVYQRPKYRKIVPLPRPVKSKDTTATCKNGVLEIILPKKEEISEQEDIYIR